MKVTPHKICWFRVIWKLGLHDDVKFLVVSSDVIYPAGSMHDYEANFYLPYQGFAKPIYAVPGNHDWFDALEGFNANFLEPKAARAAMEARVDADLGLTTTTARRIERLIAAARLRAYGVSVGTQRAVFFELQTDGFALLAIDTGILRTIDERQWTWLERALDPARASSSWRLWVIPLCGRLRPRCFRNPRHSLLPSISF